MKKILSAIFMIVLLTCGTVFAKENSPEWIKNLDAAKNANQIFVIQELDKLPHGFQCMKKILQEIGNRL